jgi:archaellum component FlaF (FlaF/FlaG flagellin family)
MISLPKDANRITVIGGTSSADGVTVVAPYVDPITHRLYVNATVSGSTIASHIQTDVFTSTNNQTTFVPSQTLIQDNGMYVMGSRQTPSTDYSIIGGQYVLNNGIPSGCAVILEYIY